MSDAHAWPGLLGRQAECGALIRLLEAVHAGDGRALVLRGEAGIGKTALLEFLVRHAGTGRVARAAGFESEMQLGYAGLHQLCRPFLDRIDDLPAPQRDALGTALGLRPGSAPDRFHVGLAALTLLCRVAEEESLICVVDDAQWLDRESVRALEFVARRVGAEPVGLVFAVRPADGDPLLGRLPDLPLTGLNAADAAALLAAAVPGPIDRRVRDRVLGESHGNPRMLLALPAGAELAFGPGPGPSGPASPTGRRERKFVRQVGALPAPSRRLLLAAAADPLGDVGLLTRAAERLGIGSGAVEIAEASGLLAFGTQVGFRDPLVRSAVYRTAPPAERRRVHQVLADVTDPTDPDRRAWHHARAVVGTDEQVAAELEDAAGRAGSTGGVAAVGAFLEAAATLTPDPVERGRRSLEAGAARAAAGAFDDALALLATADASSVDEAGRARIDLLRAQIADDSAHDRDAVPLLLAAARRLEALDPRRARDTYLEALSAALVAGRLAREPATAVRRVAAAARAAPLPDRPGPGDGLLEAISGLHTEGFTRSAPLLRRAVHTVTGSDLPLDEAVHSLPAAAAAAAQLWDDDRWDALTQRQVDVARGAGALGVLPRALAGRALVAVRCGNLSAAAPLVAERKWLAQRIGAAQPPTVADEAWLAAVQGDADTAEPLLRAAVEDATARGQGAGVDLAHAARAVLCNGLGRYEDALAAARAATAGPPGLQPAGWALAELVEAGVRAGDTTAALRAGEALSAISRGAGTDWALGVAAGTAALLGDDDEAEDLHREALERLERTRVRLDLARARLRYGEWLRRQGRRVDARAQLRTAHGAFTAMGADAFAERARHELVATGETVRRRSEETREALTAQEGHIARLAADGLTNPEIAAQLYLSPRTVEWHLRKVFTKVGVSTRRQLRRSLDDARPR